MASALHQSRALRQSPREIFPHRCRIVTAANRRRPPAAGLSPLPGIVFAASGTPLPKSFSAYPTFQAHFWLATLLVGLIVLHVGAALHHQFVQRDGLLRRMGFGRRVNTGTV
jgi:hypothetical protein